MLRPVAILLALTVPAGADELSPVLADYWTDSGSLPPEYAWETSVLIREDGQLELKHCKGYETEGPACKLRHAKVAAPERYPIQRAVNFLHQQRQKRHVKLPHKSNSANGSQDSPKRARQIAPAHLGRLRLPSTIR